jgi:hypothetical protein
VDVSRRLILDSRIALIRRTGGTPVTTLCCVPDWMKGGRPGTTDWSKLEVAPAPGHYADFAALAATIARRYPFVRHFLFLVWNEFNLAQRTQPRQERPRRTGRSCLVMQRYRSVQV